jgi:4-hydroxy-4-methyl-2-oxoglutarate aldolase
VENDELAALLIQAGTATLADLGARCFLGTISPVWSGASVAGPAYCVELADRSNLALHAALQVARAGSVIVAAARESSPATAYWGQVLTTHAQARGVAGLVIDGGVRDTDAMRNCGFPVFARSVSLTRPTRDPGGTIGGRAVPAGVDVATGDWVVGDGDGLVVLDRSMIHGMLGEVRKHLRWESDILQKLRDPSHSTVTLFDLDTASVLRQ